MVPLVPCVLGVPVIDWGFWARFGPRALREIPGPGQKTETRNFPEVDGFFWGTSVRPNRFSPKPRNFFAACVLAQRAGNREILDFQGPFGPALLALGETPGQKRKNAISQS